jgi:pimeloyl-ACP methyl ester carboxylesterase
VSKELETVQSLNTPDDRVLTYTVTGDPHGMPVFLLHGTPGSHRGPKPRPGVLYRQGVRLICYDRPGYGGSSRHKDRQVAHAAADVKAIADRLNIDRFAVIGRSGGAPHALACAAMLPDEVMRTVALVSVAPANAPGLDWYEGMAPDNVEEYSAIDADTLRLTERLRARANRTSEDPETLIEILLSQMTDPDLHVVGDYAIRRLLASTYAEGLREGPFGWVDDVLALRSDWGFQVENIKGPVLLWHGAEDNFSPVSHTRWLAAKIPDSELQIQQDTAHFGAVEILPRMLGWLTAWHSEMSAAGSPC